MDRMLRDSIARTFPLFLSITLLAYLFHFIIFTPYLSPPPQSKMLFLPLPFPKLLHSTWSHVWPTPTIWNVLGPCALIINKDADDYVTSDLYVWFTTCIFPPLLRLYIWKWEVMWEELYSVKMGSFSFTEIISFFILNFSNIWHYKRFEYNILGKE